MPRLRHCPADPRTAPGSGRPRRALALTSTLCTLVLPCAALAQPAPAPAAQPAPPPPAAQPAPPPPAAQPAPPPPAAQPPQPPPPAQPPQPPPPAQPGYPPPGYGSYPYYYPQYPQYPPPGGYYYPPQGYGPQAPPPKPVELRRNNPSLMAGGIALTLAGAAGLVVSAILVSAANGRYEIYCSDQFGGQPYRCREESDEGLLTAGWITLGGGIAAMAVGIPLWVIGGRRVPVNKDAAPASTQGRARQPAITPSVAIGLGSASVKLAF